MSLVETIAPWCVGVLLISIVACLFRLLRGPYSADRVVALDVISLLVVAILGVRCLEVQQDYYLAVALVLALVSFLTTVAWAFYIRHYAREKLEESDGS